MVAAVSFPASVIGNWPAVGDAAITARLDWRPGSGCRVLRRTERRRCRALHALDLPEQGLYKEFIRPQATEKQLLFRIAADFDGGRHAEVVLAMLLPSIIAALSIFYGLVTVSLFVPVVAGILSNRPTAATAMVSLALAVPEPSLFTWLRRAKALNPLACRLRPAALAAGLSPSLIKPHSA